MRCINGFQGLILKGEMYRNLPGSQENKGIVNPRNFYGIKGIVLILMYLSSQKSSVMCNNKLW